MNMSLKSLVYQYISKENLFFLLKYVGVSLASFFLGVVLLLEYPSFFGNKIVLDLTDNLYEDSEIIAKGKGVVVYKSELDAKISNVVNANANVKNISDEAKKLIINEIAAQKLILDEAIKSNVHHNQIVKDNIKNYATKIVKTSYLEKFINQVVTEDNIKSVYSQLKNKLDGKLEYKASHILVNSKKEANNLYKKVTSKPKDFGKIAKKHSLDNNTKDNGGSLGYIIEGQMIKEFEDKLKKAKNNEIIRPFQTNLGWHVVLLEDKKNAEAASYDNARDTVKGELARNSIKSHIIELLNNAEFEIY